MISLSMLENIDRNVKAGARRLAAPARVSA
jgi:hypothetical protein